MTAPIAQVAATILSPITLWLTGCSSSTPWMVMVLVPAPLIRAPISLSRSQMSTISGSRAAFFRTEVPCASTAAVTNVSVAPTEGKLSS